MDELKDVPESDIDLNEHINCDLTVLELGGYLVLTCNKHRKDIVKQKRETIFKFENLPLSERRKIIPTPAALAIDISGDSCEIGCDSCGS